MTVNQFGAELATITVNNVPLKFAHYAWSHAPAGDYGVYSEDSALDFAADGTSLEQAIEGTLDYYTRSDGTEAKDAIQTKLRELGIVWHLNSVQYESDTGLVHYEWVWRLYGC